MPIYDSRLALDLMCNDGNVPADKRCCTQDLLDTTVLDYQVAATAFKSHLSLAIELFLGIPKSLQNIRFLNNYSSSSKKDYLGNIECCLVYSGHYADRSTRKSFHDNIKCVVIVVAVMQLSTKKYCAVQFRRASALSIYDTNDFQTQSPTSLSIYDNRRFTYNTELSRNRACQASP